MERCEKPNGAIPSLPRSHKPENQSGKQNGQPTGVDVHREVRSVTHEVCVTDMMLDHTTTKNNHARFLIDGETCRRSRTYSISKKRSHEKAEVRGEENGAGRAVALCRRGRVLTAAWTAILLMMRRSTHQHAISCRACMTTGVHDTTTHAVSYSQEK
jgi:hypothetical protein